jgi:hypothetical protein
LLILKREAVFQLKKGDAALTTARRCPLRVHFLLRFPIQRNDAALQQAGVAIYSSNDLCLLPKKVLNLSSHVAIGCSVLVNAFVK